MKCSKHPDYKAIRYPWSECPQCLAIWNAKANSEVPTKSRARNMPIMCGPAFGSENKWFSIQASAKAGEQTEITIYDTIGKDWWSDKGVEASVFADELKKIPRNQKILVRISSPGGSVNDGLLIYNLLRERKEHVTCRIDSVAASIASVIALAGKSLEMPRNAKLMIHNPWTSVEGDSREMRKVADKLDVFRDSIAIIYQQKTGRKVEEIQEWMNEETWMIGDSAKDKGFCDVVTDEEISFQACARFDLSNFKRVPEQLKAKSNKKENSMNRDQIIAELNKLSVTFNAEATDEELQELLDTAQAEAKNKTKTKATPKAAIKKEKVERIKAGIDKVEDLEVEDEEEEEEETPAPKNRLTKHVKPNAEVENRLKAIEAKYEAERKNRIQSAVQACVDEDRIPAAQAEKWVARAMADEAVLDDLRAMEPRRPGVDPLNLTVATEDPKAIERGILNLRAPLESWKRGNSVEPKDVAAHAKAIAVAIQKNRKRLDGILNANTIHTDLKRNVILSDLMRDFKRVLLMLNVFTTKFTNVPLEGTNKVVLPFYDLDTTASTNFDANNGYLFAEDTTVGTREVTVNKRKYKTMNFSSETFRRQPYFQPEVAMRLKVEQLAVDIWTDILSVVTDDNFNDVAFAGEAGSFDTDDLITIRRKANNADWPVVGRACVLGTDHEAALLSDDAIKHFQNSGSTAALREGSTGKLFGFDMFYSPRIPTNSEDLAGFICLPPAALVATAPIAPAPGVRSQLLSYDLIIDPDTGLAFEYRYGADTWMDKDREVVECNYGFGKGNGRALQRITFGSNDFSSSSSQSSVNSSSSSSSSPSF